MSVDDAEVGLTERGRRALRAPDGLRADHLLYLEILARIGGCGGDKNVDGMTDELIAHFGSAELRSLPWSAAKSVFRRSPRTIDRTPDELHVVAEMGIANVSGPAVNDNDGDGSELGVA
jgi:hypothetical protein